MRAEVKPQARSEETRIRILDAALELFHDRGFASTTMREVAGKAGVASGAAYYYFESKDAIVLAFYDRARQEMEPRLEQALAGKGGLRQQIERILQVKLDYFAPSRSLLAALTAYTNPRHPLSPFSTETTAIREHDMDFFKRALETSRTRIPEDLRPFLPQLLWMYQMGILLFWINDDSPNRAKTTALIDASLTAVIRLIQFAGLPLTRPIRKAVITLLETLAK